jgi:glycosyltransferase involved in cell wall biosynthesis
MKVLFLASWFPNKEDRYSGIFIKRHAQAVSKYCDVGVLYLHFTKHKIPSEIEVSIEDDMKIVRIYFGGMIQTSTISKLVSFFLLDNGFFLTLKGIRTIFRHLGTPDIVHVNVLLPSGWLALILNYVYGIPYVLTEHTNPFKIFLIAPVKRFFSKLILIKAKKIMPVSKYLQESMISFYKSGNYGVVPNVVNTALFNPHGKIQKLSERKVILHVSRLDDQLKNISGILDAISLLSNERNDFLLAIIGEGIDKQKLEEKATQLKIKDMYVYFLGSKTDEELACYMRNSQFFVLNSRQETFCVVCIEALSSGIPVVSTRCGAPEEYIDERNGVLVDSEDTYSLKMALDFMLSHYQNFNPESIHADIQNNFSQDKVGEVIVNEYLNILTP